MYNGTHVRSQPGWFALVPLANKTQRWKLLVTKGEAREVRAAAKRAGLHASEFVVAALENPPPKKPDRRQQSLLAEKVALEPKRPVRMEVRLGIKLHAKAVGMGQANARDCVLRMARK